MIVSITALVRKILGTSLTAIRLLPAVAGAVTVALAGLIARALGGGRFAQFLAALSVVVAPAYLGSDHLMTMNAFEPVFWTGCAYFLIRLINGGDPREWLWVGVLAGLGLENKYSMFLFCFGLVVGLVLTGERRLLRTKGPWLAALIALAIFLPNLIWEIHHGFLSFFWVRYHHVAGKNVPLTAIEFIGEQIVEMQPFAAPIWLAGVWFYFGTRKGKPYRLLGWTSLVVFLTLLLVRGRVYYVFPVYPMLLGSGAVFLESAWHRRAWVRSTMVAALVLGGVFLAPFALPVLPVETYMRYSDALNIDPPDIEQRKLGKLPQLYSDTFGWEEMTAAVSRVYDRLPPQQRSQTAIFANDYGEAAAIDFFGPKQGLPPAISPHQEYFDLGPAGYTGASVLLLGHNARLETECGREEQVGRVHNDYSMPYENFPIIVCHNLKRPLKEVWPALKQWE